MNRIIKLATIAALATPLAASAAQDFSAVNRDVSVMAQILTGAFKSDKHAGPHASIAGTYLADQGALFTVKAYGRLNAYSFRFGGDDTDDNVFYFQGDDDEDSMAPMPPDAPDAPGINMGDLGHITTTILAGGDGSMHIDREVRSAMRDVARQLRDIEQQISDNRIELIHTDKDEGRKKIESKIAELEKQQDVINGKQEQLEKQMADARKKFEEKRKAMSEKVKKAREENLAKTEKVVMESLCAYGSTLKNVPDREHVSVIIEGRAGGATHHVYVMNKKDVSQCKSGGADALAKNATKYSF